MIRARRAVHYAVVAGIIGASYCTGIERVSFRGDESYWIATSYYLEVFLGGRTEGILPEAPRPFWTENWVILTQPPLARYVIGAGRRLGGFGVADLNAKWNYEIGARANEAAGGMPSERLLFWSRVPMAAFSTLSGLLIFSLTWRCAGLVAGYVFALGFAFNPYLLQTLRRATGEATLTLFFVFAVVATERGARAVRTRALSGSTFRANSRPFAWWLLAGLCCGLAGAAKLNGLLLAGGVALAAWVAMFFAGAEWAPVIRHRTALWASTIVLAAAALSFVAPNPFLYPDPVRRTVQMWRHRFYEMEMQRANFPQARLDGVTDRSRALARNVSSRLALLRFPNAWLINGGFAIWGLLVLTRRGLRSLKERLPGTEVVILLLGASVVVPAFLTPLNWDRYYLFPVLFAGLCSAVGVSAAVDLARRSLRPSP